MDETQPTPQTDTVQTATPESQPVQASADVAPVGVSVDQPAVTPAASDSMPPVDASPAPVELPHPVFAELAALQDSIVARTAEEMHKLQNYVQSIRNHLVEILKGL